MNYVSLINIDKFLNLAKYCEVLLKLPILYLFAELMKNDDRYFKANILKLKI